ncbi:MAG: hypothetical protein GY723_10640 [bacterium]|nr:hypothetical protein [bacterium]MCP5067145.1 hypothetical protein [bacterium]
MSSPREHSLTTSHKLEYGYKRSLGPVLSRFFTGIRDRKILGARRADGTVIVPPKEYDPDTSAALDELTPVGPGGVVKSWAWVSEPRRQQPLDRAFAYALIQLDGADTSFLHVVDAKEESAMNTGMRVVAAWSDQATGAITDLSFVPESKNSREDAN